VKENKMSRVVTALFLAGLVSAAVAQDRKPNEQGQTPPKEEVKCVSSNTSFQRKGNSVVLQVLLTNVCEQRQRCTINAYTVSAFGAKQGEKKVTLAPASKGDKAKRALEIKVRQAGGATYSSFSCK
jgi:cytoskeletal protein RodZ